MGLFVFMVATLAASITSADTGKPGWVTDPPTNTESFYYVIGIGEADSLPQAKFEAEQNAWFALVDLLIGTTTTATKKMVSDLNNTGYSVHQSASSDVLKIAGFETESLFEEPTKDEKIRVYVLKKLAKTEAINLKKKFAGKQNRAQLSSIYISTNPGGARIIVNEENMGISPIRLLLPLGRYTLKIEKEGYSKIQKELLIEDVRTIDINLALESESGKLMISRVDPDAAQFFIDGKLLQEKAPISIDIAAGQHLILVRAQGFNDWVKNIVVKPNQTLEYEIALTRRIGSTADDLKKLEDLAATNQIDQLVKAAERFVRQYPDSGYGYLYKAVASVELNSNEAAINYALKAKKRFSSCPNCDHIICRAAYHEQNLKIAVLACKHAVHLAPNIPSFHLTLAQVFNKLGDENILRRGEFLRQAYHEYVTASKLDAAYAPFLKKFCKSFEARYSNACVD